MKLCCFFPAVNPVFLLLLPLLLTAPQEQVKQEALTPAKVRTAVTEVYTTWGKARVAKDKETLNSIMAPDFYALLDGKRIGRAPLAVSDRRIGPAPLSPIGLAAPTQ